MFLIFQTIPRNSYRHKYFLSACKVLNTHNYQTGINTDGVSSTELRKERRSGLQEDVAVTFGSRKPRDFGEIWQKRVARCFVCQRATQVSSEARKGEGMRARLSRTWWDNLQPVFF